jgi:class I fructose-bisphosphate aldolase
VQTGKQIRLRRLWKHRRAVFIPYDHGAYSGGVPGLEDPRRLTERIARTAADGILVTPGTLKQIASAVGDLAVILRLDGGVTKFSPELADYAEMAPVAEAARLGADAAIVFTFIGTPDERDSLKRLGATAIEADAWGLALIAEILPPALLANHFGRVQGDVKVSDTVLEAQSVDAARLGSESGADIIKTRFTGNVAGFRRVLRSCGLPVIVAGGPPLHGTSRPERGSEVRLLQLAYDAIRAGAAGIIFGRNVWQHPRMEKVIAALCAIVHDEESVESARKLLR